MPRSKTTESRNNIHKGVRTLSKKVSKKGSKKKNYNTTTEEMLEILNSEQDMHTNMHTGNPKMTSQQANYLNQYQQNVDPFLVTDAVQTDANGNMINTNKIGALLGGVAQINSNYEYTRPMNLNNNMSFGVQEQHSMSQQNAMPQFNNQLMDIMSPQMNNMMPQQMNNMMPQQMNNTIPQFNNQLMDMMPQQMNNTMPQQINQNVSNSFIKNIAALSSIPRIA